jgi:catalase
MLSQAYGHVLQRIFPGLGTVGAGNFAGLLLTTMPKTNPPADGRNNSGKSASKGSAAAKAAARNTDSGPARVNPDAGGDAQAEKMAQIQALAAAMPFNSIKPAEHGIANAMAPQRGATAETA